MNQKLRPTESNLQFFCSAKECDRTNIWSINLLHVNFVFSKWEQINKLEIHL